MFLFNVLSNLTKTWDIGCPGIASSGMQSRRVVWMYTKRHTHKGVQGGKDDSTATWKANHLSRGFMGSAEFDLSALAIGEAM